MKTSSNGIKFICDAEGFRSEAYQDGGGVWTIGYGSIRVDGRAVCKGDKCSKEEAVSYLEDEVTYIESKINKYVVVPLTQNQFDSLVSFCYNLGVTAFRVSTLLKKLNVKDYVGASNEILRWNKDNGKVVEGLTNRRKREKELFDKTV